MAMGEIDVNWMIGAFAAGLGKDKMDAANRFRKLPSTPPKKLFKQFDFHYPGRSWIANVKQDEEAGKLLESIFTGHWAMAVSPPLCHL